MNNKGADQSADVHADQVAVLFFVYAIYTVSRDEAQNRLNSIAADDNSMPDYPKKKKKKKCLIMI